MMLFHFLSTSGLYSRVIHMKRHQSNEKQFQTNQTHSKSKIDSNGDIVLQVIISKTMCFILIYIFFSKFRNWFKVLGVTYIFPSLFAYRFSKWLSVLEAQVYIFVALRTNILFVLIIVMRINTISNLMY